MNLQKIRTVDREQFFLKSQTLCPKIFSFHTGLGCALGKGKESSLRTGHGHKKIRYKSQFVKVKTCKDKTISGECK